MSEPGDGSLLRDPINKEKISLKKENAAASKRTGQKILVTSGVRSHEAEGRVSPWDPGSTPSPLPFTLNISFSRPRPPPRTSFSSPSISADPSPS